MLQLNVSHGQFLHCTPSVKNIRSSRSVPNSCFICPYKSLDNAFVTAAPSPSASSGGATASPPKANVAARSPGGSATVLLATVVTSLLAFYYL
uniref:Uncharacterized protein n=1 Tax=Aegilops tauschii subsp. strangulata TaxID=200361 RepID=A0A453PMW4_AEGTS